MKHIFDVGVAKKYGVNAAILLENMCYWIKQNEANETNFFDGTYWTFNSRRAYKELFPYMSERQINTAFQKLIDDGLLITGHYNSLAYDRTMWYALSNKGKAILHFDIMDSDKMSNGYSQNDIMDSTKMSNGFSQNVRPIPNINTNINTDINTDIFYDAPQAAASKTTKRFSPPTVEEVRAYCIERQNNVDAERFVDYYTSNGWQVGKNKMKDWKAAVRTWERNRSSSQSISTANNNPDDGLDGIL